MKLPLPMRVRDLPLVVTRLGSASLPALREWVQTYYGRERDVIEDDVLPYKAINEWHEPGRTSLAVFKESETTPQKRTLVAAILIYPSLLSRSTVPVNSSAHVLVRPDFWGRGIGTAMLHVTHRAAWDSGYLDHVTRVVARSASTKELMRKHNKVVVGILPHSLYFRGQGRLSDLVTHHTEKENHPEEYEQRLARIERKRNVPITPTLTAETLVPDWLFTETVLQCRKCRIRGYEQPCILRAGKIEDIWIVDNLIRTAAEKGHGFGLDEFKDGFFNRKFMRKCYTAVLCAPDGFILGAALFGLSSLCHSVTSPVLQFYVIVAKPARARGIGMNLLSAVTDYAVKHDFIAIYGDAYEMDSYGTQFLIRNGFKQTSALPHCGYLFKHGLSHGSLYCKDIRSLYRETIKSNIHET